jgi:hypothetical protein
VNDVFSLALPAVFWYNGNRQGGTNYGKGKKAEADQFRGNYRAHKRAVSRPLRGGFGTVV